MAAGVLTSFDVSLETVRSQAVQVLNAAQYRPSFAAAPRRYSAATRAALDEARLAARWNAHHLVYTKDLLVGARQRTGLAARVLAEVGVDRDQLHVEAESFGREQAIAESLEGRAIVTQAALARRS